MKTRITLSGNPILVKYVITGIELNKFIGWYYIYINGIETDVIINKNNFEMRNVKTGKKIKPEKCDRYWRVCFNIYGNKIRIQYHRLLSVLFIPIPEMLQNAGYNQLTLYPNHKDGNKEHNTLDNLEWSTPRYNTIHAFETGLSDNSIREKSHLATIANNDAIEICKLLSEGYTCKDVSIKTGIGLSIIRHIYNGESWKSISRDYVFPKKSNARRPYSKDDAIIKMICKDIEEAHKKGVIKDKEISKRYGVSREYVRDIRNHKRRTNISKGYDF